MLVNALKQRLTARALRPSLAQVRMFSADDSAAEKQVDTETHTKEEIEKGRQEWGIKYDDECLKFEKEWKLISDKIDAEQMVYIESELSELQKKKVDMIADRLLDLNVFEMRYLAASTKQRIERTSGINPLKLNMDWPSIKQDDMGTWPPTNPNWFKQQDLMSSLGPFMGMMGGGAPAAGGAAP